MIHSAFKKIHITLDILIIGFPIEPRGFRKKNPYCHVGIANLMCKQNSKTKKLL